jgi:hypothetical protein
MPEQLDDDADDSERLTHAYLRQRPDLTVSIRERWGSRVPDFTVRSPLGTVVLEVYSPTVVLPSRAGAFDSVSPSTGAFKARKRKQGEAVTAADVPYVVVLGTANSSIPLGEFELLGAMFGKKGVSPSTNTRSLAVVSRFNPTSWRYDAAFEQRTRGVKGLDQLLINGLALEQGLTERGPFDPEARVARMRIVHNPWAAIHSIPGGSEVRTTSSHLRGWSRAPKTVALQLRLAHQRGTRRRSTLVTTAAAGRDTLLGTRSIPLTVGREFRTRRCRDRCGSYLSRMPEAELPQDHWVSRGYQQNFATDDKRVAVFSPRVGRVIESGRPIKSNFRERGFTTFLQAGVPNGLLERAFASVEARVLNEIRRISRARSGPQQRADVANLFAVHLARSPGFRSFHRHITERFREDDIPAFATNDQLIERFQASEGRRPSEQELLDLSLRVYDEMAADPLSLATSMARQHDAIAEKLNGFHLQIIELSPGLPGLVLGDTPVVHAHFESDRYGFRDHLAIGDANFIFGPLTRTTAACFTNKRLPPVLVKTRKMVDTINGVFLRAALAEVACHPDDAKALRQTHSRIDRLPPSALTGG